MIESGVYLADRHGIEFFQRTFTDHWVQDSFIPLKDGRGMVILASENERYSLGRDLLPLNSLHAF